MSLRRYTVTVSRTQRQTVEFVADTDDVHGVDGLHRVAAAYCSPDRWELGHAAVKADSVRSHPVPQGGGRSSGGIVSAADLDGMIAIPSSIMPADDDEARALIAALCEALTDRLGPNIPEIVIVDR